jgi:hypothetical protein
MNSRGVLLGAVRGPLMLVAFGVLMLMWQNAGISFSKTWPILFIVFGVLKLVERLVRPEYEPPAGAGYAGTGTGVPPGQSPMGGGL